MCLPETIPFTHRRRGLALVIIAWGVQAIVTQSLLLREALVLMFGSELAWGVVLFAWLFGVAAGAAVGGRLTTRIRRADVALVVVLLPLSGAACAELWIFRGARAWLGIEPGELLPLAKTALAAMAFISPTSALIGLAFPLACCVTPTTTPTVTPISTDPPRQKKGDAPPRQGLLTFANVYALESAGSLIGGALFTFWAVEHLSPIQTAMGCFAITAFAAAVFLRSRRGPLAAGGLAAVGLLVAAAAICAGDAINERLVLRRWNNVARGYELCAEVESKYQNLAIGRRAEQYSLYCDGHVAGDFPDPYSTVPLAHFWMCQHPNPRRVLVLGGGAEGLLAEILRHPIEHVDYVEPDPRLISLVEPYLPETDSAALHDARVTVHAADARYFIKTQRAAYDLVIARLPEPTSALCARYYTDAFFRELRRAMTDRSVLCLTAAATPADLPAAAAAYLASLRATLALSFPEITIGWGNPAQVLCATKPGLVSMDSDTLVARYESRGVTSEWFHPMWFEGATDWLDAEKVRARQEQLDTVRDVQISTDLRPAIYLQRLALWEQMTGGTSGPLIEWLRRVRWTQLVGVIAIGMGIALCVGRLRGRGREGWASGTVLVSISTTGFATMALSILWLFAFQNLYGYVYQRIGWIIALFMGGLVIGCWLGGRSGQPAHASDASRTGDAKCGARLWPRLVVVDGAIALLALSVPWVLSALGGLQGPPFSFTAVEVAVSMMVAVTGVLCGAAFALAGGLQLSLVSHAGLSAGMVDSADHAGACLGALLTGVLLVPVFGTAAAAYLLVGIKLSSAALLLWGRRVSRAA